MTRKQPRILCYDIETSLLEVRVFRLGEQVIRPSQLIDKKAYTKIICASYGFVDEPLKNIKTVGYGFRAQNSLRVVKDLAYEFRESGNVGNQQHPLLIV